MKKKKDKNQIDKCIKVVLCDVNNIDISQVKDKKKEVMNLDMNKVKEIIREAMYKSCLACNKSSDMWKDYYFSIREESLSECNAISEEEKENLVKDAFEKQKKKIKKDKLDNEKYMNKVYKNVKERTLKKLMEDIEKKIEKRRVEEYGITFTNVVQGKTKLIMKDYNTANVGCLDQKLVQANWNRDKEKILSYEARIPQYKKDTPYFFHNNNYNIEKTNTGEYYISVAMFSEHGCKELNLIQRGFKIRFKVDKIDNSKRMILDRMINGEYKQGSAQISISNKDKIEFIMSFNFIKDEFINLDKNRTLGIDLGIVNVATMAIYDSNTDSYDYVNYKSNIMSGKELISFRQKLHNMNETQINKEIKKKNNNIHQKQLNKFNIGIIDGFEINNMRNTTEKRRDELKIASKWRGDGSKGRGRKARTRTHEAIGDKIDRFKDTFNHKYSKYIVEFAVKNNCGVIQMEDLSGATSNTKEKFLKDWAYYDLQSKIEYKAKEYRIEFIKVNPKYTSKRCNKCGNIHIDNRNGKENQAKFECVVCKNNKDNADINAAKNIAIPNIDSIIKQTKVLGLKEKVN